MTTLTLISHPLCPYVQRAAIALAEKGVAFERLTIGLDEKPDWFGAISPLGKVPLLQIGRDGPVLFESAAICEYLDETQAGQRLHPEDPVARARHRAWMEFGSSVLADIWGFETAREADVFAAKRHALAAKFATIEGALGSGPWFAGASFSLVDAVFGPVFRYFEVFETIADLDLFDGLSRIAAWRTALRDRPSVRDAVDPAYPQLLRAFLERHDAYLLRLGAEREVAA